MQKRVRSSMETYLEINVIFVRLDKVPGLWIKLEDLFIYDMISDNDFSLNLCAMPTIYHVVIILDNEILRRSKKVLLDSW